MALPTSGTIKLSEVGTEFSDSQPHSMSEFYGAASGVPTSGIIALSDFYGTSAFSLSYVGSVTGSWNTINDLTNSANAIDVNSIAQEGDLVFVFIASRADWKTDASSITNSVSATLHELIDSTPAYIGHFGYIVGASSPNFYLTGSNYSSSDGAVTAVAVVFRESIASYLYSDARVYTTGVPNPPSVIRSGGNLWFTVSHRVIDVTAFTEAPTGFTLANQISKTTGSVNSLTAVAYSIDDASSKDPSSWGSYSYTSYGQTYTIGIAVTPS